MEKLIITAAVVGAELTRADTPYLPLTPEEIAQEACRCCDAGASVIHLHARDSGGNPTQKADVYREIINLIRKETDCIIQVSTGGAVGMTAQERLEPVGLDVEMATLTTGTVNFGNDVFYNSPAMIAEFAAAIHSQEIKPEIEVFDAGMVATALRLWQKGFIHSPLHFDFVLGVPGGMPAEIKNLIFLSQSLPQGSTWSVAAVGRHQLPLTTAAILLGGHVRVGLEDNIYYSKGRLSQGNVPLVKRTVRLAAELQREVASVEAARQILSLPRRK